jgi:hypothetical protein
MVSLNGPRASIGSTEVTQMETQNCFTLQNERDTESIKFTPNDYLISLLFHFQLKVNNINICQYLN